MVNGRIYDGKPLDTRASPGGAGTPGSDTQELDVHHRHHGRGPPAFRGTAYVVFEDLPLNDYGNRLPQLSFEVFRPLADPDTTEGLTRAVTLIPASGEFTYATEAIRKAAMATAHPRT